MSENYEDVDLKPIPPIAGEVDEPLKPIEIKKASQDLQMREQAYKHQSETFKTKTGTFLLFGCIGVMILFSIVQLVMGGYTDMFSMTFDLLKMIVMALLGFLFGRSNK